MANPTNILVDKNVVKRAFPLRGTVQKVICFYLDDKGVSPAEEWQIKLCGCNNADEFYEEFYSGSTRKKNQKLIIRKLAYYLEAYIAQGLRPKVPEHYEYLEPIECYEIKWGQGRFIGFYDDNRFIVVHGFRKKSRKTPSSDLKLAKQRKQDYFNRKKALGLA